MKITSKEAFAARVPQGVKVHEVRLGEDTFFIREMNAKRRTEFDLTLDPKKNPKGLSRFREKLLVATISDEAGNLVFTPDDEGMIRDCLVSVVEPLFNRAAEINGLSNRDIEDLRKNSETTPEQD